MPKKNIDHPRIRVVRYKKGYSVVCPQGFYGLSEPITSTGKTKNTAMINMIELLLTHVRGLETQVDAMSRIEKYLVNIIENNRGY